MSNLTKDFPFCELNREGWLENGTRRFVPNVDYRMVLRVMEAEIISYDKQRKEAYRIRRRNNKKFDKHEYLSRMKRGQKFIPVITLVIYFGRERLWDGARNLHSMLDIGNDLRPFVNDYRLNLFDYHDYDNFEIFKTEIRLIFEALANGNNKKKMKKILEENNDFRKVDQDTVNVIFGVLGIKYNIGKIKYVDEEGKEVYNMCKAFDDYKEEGKREGKREGKQEMAIKMIKSLMKNQKITFEAAADILGVSKSNQKQLRTLI